VTRKIQQALENLRLNLTKAGIAAVVPLLSAPKLTEAMKTGYECPPGMKQRMFERLARHEHKAVRTPSRRVAVSQQHGWMWFVAGFTVMIGAMGAFLALSSPNPIVKTPSAPVAVRTPAVDPPVVADVASSPPAVLSRSWNFNTHEQASDFKVVTGAWHFVADGGLDGSGCMETESESFLAEMDVKPESLPLAVTVKYRTASDRDAGSYGAGVQWIPIQAVGKFNNVGTRNLFRLPVAPWVTCTCYVTDRAIDIWNNGHRFQLWRTWYPQDAKLAISVTGKCRIDELRVERVKLTNMPDAAPFANAVDRLSPEKRMGAVDMPDLPSVVPGKDVSVEFMNFEKGQSHE